jgi:16S rRNA (cytosine967-C5)-methyltransferase
MKIYPSIEKELISSLSYLFENKASSSKVVLYAFKKNKKWGSRDRKAFSEIFFDVVRYFGGFSEVLGKDLIHAQELTDEDFANIVEAYLDEDKRQSVQTLSPAEAVHKDLYRELKDTFNNHELITEYLQSCLSIPPVFLRVNCSKITAKELKSQLLKEGVEVESMTDSCLKLLIRKNVLQLESYKSGYFEIQDGASQEVAPFLELNGALRIADTCAGAGGKSLHISDLLKGRGRVLALDISERRLDELKKRAKRSGFHNIETRVIKNNKTLKRLSESFDRVLIDAPCSGTGTFRRKPEGKLHFRKEKLNEYIKSQKEILALHSKLLKPGGLLVYATCSVLKSENEDQVKSFLDENEQFKLIEMKSNAMGDRDFDGFFMAKMQKS